MRTPRLPHGRSAFVEALAGCRALVVAGADAPPGAPPVRELGRLAATAAAARAGGLRVAVQRSVGASAGTTHELALVRALRAAAHELYDDADELGPLLDAAAEIARA
jgi:hypothetical protein